MTDIGAAMRDLKVQDIPPDFWKQVGDWYISHRPDRATREVTIGKNALTAFMRHRLTNYDEIRKLYHLSAVEREIFRDMIRLLTWHKFDSWRSSQPPDWRTWKN